MKAQRLQQTNRPLVVVAAEQDYGNPLPNPDALQEFRVETNNFAAQYGRMSGAVVTAVTRSGTNQWHGSLFEFNRNTGLNATPWNSTFNPPYHRNQFGGADGNAPRDYLRAPGYRDVDLALLRDVRFERGIVFQIRGEATNAFNLVSLNAPTASLSSGNNGKITAAASPHLLQVGARLTF